MIEGVWRVESRATKQLNVKCLMYLFDWAAHIQGIVENGSLPDIFWSSKAV